MKKTLKNRIVNILMKMMITCEQASYLIDKEQYTRLSFKERFDLKIHLMTCKFCRLYKVESHMINDKITKVFTFDNVKLELNEDQKKRLLEKLN